LPWLIARTTTTYSATPLATAMAAFTNAPPMPAPPPPHTIPAYRTRGLPNAICSDDG
jgi:hypothetical protein